MNKRDSGQNVLVKGNAAIDIYMKDKYIFPYDYLSDAKIELERQNKYNIYFVLKAYRYNICNIKIYDQYNFVVDIRDAVDGNVLKIPLNIQLFIQVPSLEYVRLSIVNNKSVLQIDFTEKGMKFLEKNHLEFVEYNKKIIEKYGHMRFEMHVNFLRNLFFEFQGRENIEKYELLYIGQTKKDNIYQRLYSHNTIPEIVRNLNREDNNEKYELDILVTGVHIKYYEENEIKEYLTNIISANSLQDDFLINEGLIAREEVVNIAEAMLILFFKPEYNDKLKNTKKPEELNTYRIFNECLINPITYSLDLYFEDTKKKVILKTNTASTEYKQNLLVCKFNDSGSVDEIKLDYFPKDYYW